MDPETDQLLFEAGNAHAAGRLSDAESMVRRVLAIDPQNISARLLFGVLAAKTNRSTLAVEALSIVAESDPQRFEAPYWLSIVYRQHGNSEDATRFAEIARRVRPNDAHVENNLGLCYLNQNRIEEAIGAFQSASRHRPDLAPIFHNLGTALYLVGREQEAATAFESALRLNPRSLESFLSLGQARLSSLDPRSASDAAKKALVLEPNSAEAHLLASSALVELHQLDEAELHLSRAVKLDPPKAGPQGLIGLRFQTSGRFAEANRHLKRSIALEPRQGFAYFAYVYNNKITEEDLPLIATMRELVAEASLPPRELDFLHYGIGKALETLGDYKAAILHFDEANRIARQLKFGNKRFDKSKFAAGYDWMIETFSKSFIENHQATTQSSNLPIVIVGMMRSGTTLIEQIVTSHPAVGAGSEQTFWPSRWSTIRATGNRKIDLSQLRRAGQEYVTHLQSISPHFPRVTDKMPVNYELIGPIHMANPHAKFIHVRRNPLDTAISIYTTPNRVPISYAYDRDAIVFAYKQYRRLVNHWEAVLPSNQILTVDYEDIVANSESEVRRILDFLSLDWDDRVLQPELNTRSVVTPSLWQVRQPIYKTSIDRWQNFKPWLGAFRNLI